MLILRNGNVSCLDCLFSIKSHVEYMEMIRPISLYFEPPMSLSPMPPVEFKNCRVALSVLRFKGHNSMEIVRLIRSICRPMHLTGIQTNHVTITPGNLLDILHNTKAGEASVYRYQLKNSISGKLTSRSVFFF